MHGAAAARGLRGGRELTDPSGYAASKREYAFAGVTGKQIQDMRARRAPLGLTPDQWNTTVAELREALRRDRLLDADIRQKGTSAWFYTGDLKKRFPQSEDELRKMAVRIHRDAPEVERSRRIEDAAAAYREGGFAADGPKPSVAFFDSQYRLGLSRWPSDYDMQLCSDTLANRFQQLGRADPSISLYTKGDWYSPYLLDRLAPEVDAWVKRWESEFGRWISVVTYDSAYLARTAHPDDWVVVDPRHLAR